MSIATHSNYLEIVKILLEASATTTIADSSGDYPLHMSAKKGHLEIFTELVTKMEATVHIGMKTQVMNKENHSGLTPLDGVMAALLKTIRDQQVPAKQTLDIYTRLLELSGKYPRKIVRVEEVQEGTEVLVKLANKAKQAAEADENAWDYEQGTYYGGRRNKKQEFEYVSFYLLVIQYANHIVLLLVRGTTLSNTLSCVICVTSTWTILTRKKTMINTSVLNGF